MGDVTVEAVAGLRGLHPEGPLWDADTARLWWVCLLYTSPSPRD